MTEAADSQDTQDTEDAQDTPEGQEDQEEMEALEEAVSADAAEQGENLDPLAEEMLKMMEEEGSGDAGEPESQEDVDRMMEMEMLKAMEAEGGLSSAEAAGGGRGGRAAGGGVPPNIARLMDVSLSVTIELGRTQATLESVMGLGEQSLVELDKQVGDPVDVLVNGKLFARGEVVTVSESFGVRITELLSSVSDL